MPRPGSVELQLARKGGGIIGSLSACSRQVDWKSALLLLWRNIFGAPVRSGNRSWHSAESNIAAADGEDVKPVNLSLRSYNATIGVCAKASKWEWASELVRGMRPITLAPDLVTFNTTISACERGKQWARAVQLIDSIRQANLQPDVRCYTAAVRAMAKVACWQQSFAMLLAMRDERVNPNAFTAAAAVSACSKSARWERALNIFKTSSAMRIALDTVVVNAVMDTCASSTEWRVAMDLVGTMREMALSPDEATYGTLINASEKAGRLRQALSLIDLMQETKLIPNVCNFGAAVSACEKSSAWQAALSLLRQMRAASVDANVIVCNAALSACDKAGHWPQVLWLLALMKDRQNPPNGVSFGVALNACHGGRRWKEAVRLLSEMICKALECDAIAICSVMRTLENAGHPHFVSRYLHFMHHLGLRQHFLPEEDGRQAYAESSGVVAALHGDGFLRGTALENIQRRAATRFVAVLERMYEDKISEHVAFEPLLRQICDLGEPCTRDAAEQLSIDLAEKQERAPAQHLAWAGLHSALASQGMPFMSEPVASRLAVWTDHSLSSHSGRWLSRSCGAISYGGFRGSPEQGRSVASHSSAE